MAIIKPLARRTFLRGSGALIFLPFLEAMLPQRAWAAEVPKRLAVFNFPFGVYNQAWSPTSYGAIASLPANLNSLTNLRDRIVLTRGLGMHGLPQGSHMASIPNFTGSEIRSGGAFGVKYRSPDVLLSDYIKQSAPHTKLVATTTSSNSYNVGGVHSHGGYDWNGNMSKYLSWSSTSSPTSQIQTPAALFDFLFSGFTAQPVQADPSVAAMSEFRKARGLSVLDAVKESIEKLNAKVGASDKQKLDQYFTAVREVERLINSQQPPADEVRPVCTPGQKPSGNLAFDQEHRAFLDMYVLAMACDRSRVLTHVFDTEAEVNRQMPWIGINNSPGHHLISHYDDDRGTRVPQYLKITEWYGQQLAYVLQKMASFPEMDKDLLYNSAVVFGSGMGPSGSDHDQKDLPIVIAGELQGTITTGRALNLANTRTANLWLSLLQRFGVPADSYASSNGIINL